MMFRGLAALVPAVLFAAQPALAGLSQRDLDGDPGNGYEGL